ncbi:kinase-like domain-containing protein [Astrocystis sublimbata]|nr:kinase-like domain-containing protein [Astrocystis sublimbata]
MLSVVRNNHPRSFGHGNRDSEGNIKGRSFSVSKKSENGSLPKPSAAFQKNDSESGSFIVDVLDLGYSMAPASTQAAGQSPIQDAMGVEKLRAHLGLQSNSHANVASSISEKIKSCLVYSRPHLGIHEGFLPIDKLNTVLCDNSVKALLQEEYRPEVYRDICNELDVYLCRRRILGILLCMCPQDILHLFEHFLDENITDEDLPLKRTGNPRESGFRTRSNKENISMMKHWDSNEIILFYSWQPMFFAPFFDIQEKVLYNYLLDEAIRLPWLSNEFKTRGGNGMVHRVQIHPSHHNFRSNQPSESPLYFALKEIPSDDVETYQKELLALEKPLVQMQKEKHLIKLLLTFKHGNKYYFLFEWADGHLWDYWDKFPRGSEDAIVNSMNSIWLAEQFLGLATAVKRIHGLSTWQKKIREKSKVKDKNEKEWGRHGDIKPHNVLWFSSYRMEGCVLVLSDLGLTRYHSSVTRSLVSPTSLEGYTDLYRPPEMDLPGRHICSKYDIWSLGCVFLEFCTWWLKGSRSVREFESQRASDSGMLQDPKYFVINPKVKGGDAQVKPTVLRLIKTLREDTNCDVLMGSLLNLIENNMLVVDKKKRLGADFVCTELSHILSQLKSPTLGVPRNLPYSSAKSSRRLQL